MRWLLTQNSQLRENGVFAWTLPAHIVELDGEPFNVCPNAGVCAAACYAKAGAYQFPGAKAAHLRKLRIVTRHLARWEVRMGAELSHERYQGKFVRVHDAGDFFSEEYALAWMRLAASHRGVRFYAYTKMVSLMKRLSAEGRVPVNFTLIFSLGGKEDHLIDRSRDRHSDVFPDDASAVRAGYAAVCENDSLAATLSMNRLCNISNNLPHQRKKQGRRSFGEWQEGKGAKRAQGE